jgi:predicted adenylyl cyclase CyaB
MIYEIEEKVKVTNVDAMRQKLRSQFLEQGSEVKHDTYFKHNEKDTIIRMRESGKGLLVTFKLYNSTDEGAGVNHESELGINNKKNFKEFMQLLNFTDCFAKVKRVELFTDGPLHYELVHIDELGDFLEVELLEEEESRLKEGHKMVKEAIFNLGFTEEDLIKQSYRALMGDKNNVK